VTSTVVASDPALIAFTLPTRPEAVRIARLYVRAILWFQGLDHYADDAEIITCELVTNVIRHVCDDGRDTLFVTLKHVRDPETVIICITDSSSEVPVMGKPSDGGEQGRGLLIVNELSQMWKWRRRDSGGKDVIAFLERNAGPQSQEKLRFAGRERKARDAVIGANVRVLRQRKGWSQARLAELMGWRSASTVTAAEGHRSGRQRHFTTREIRQLAAIFGVPARLLTTGCANCEGHPPAGFSCMACGAILDDRPPETTALNAPLRVVQDGPMAVFR
jgi:anti-sigma regulatory factor (Ser/Thr protein kinase)/transcriptional regulator with XRE-family HTH domain